jgi:hypothetical protein
VRYDNMGLAEYQYLQGVFAGLGLWHPLKIFIYFLFALLSIFIQLVIQGPLISVMILGFQLPTTSSDMTK